MLDQAEKKFHVLVADDSADDRFLLRAAMLHAPRLQIVHEVSDGADTIAYLKGGAGFADRRKFPLPHLLLLDLIMPKMDGFAVLEWLRANRAARMSVVVLTDSMNPRHIKRALDLGADLFQVKPRNHRDRQSMVLAIEEHLVTSADIPARHRAGKTRRRAAREGIVIPAR